MNEPKTLSDAADIRVTRAVHEVQSTIAQRMLAAEYFIAVWRVSQLT